MKSIYILQHSYELDSCDETKFIGVYESELEDRGAIKRLITQPGFRDRPEDFSIDKYELNKDHWTEGFATMISIQVKNIYDKWITVGAERLIDGTYRIIEKYENEMLREFKDMDIVKCEERSGELYAIEKINKE